MIKPDDFCKNCIQSFQEVTKKPARFLQTNGDFCDQLKHNLKEIYDYTKRQEIKVARTSALPELITENFDLEQIWQQIDLQNESFISSSLTTVSKLVVNKSGLLEESKQPETQHESPVEASTDDEDESEDVDLEDIKSDDDKPVAQKSEKGRASLVDDEFFKLSEMEKFLQAEEKKTNPDSGNDSEESDEDEASVDLFEEENDDDIETARYKDFFVSQDEKKVPPNKHLRELEEEEDDDQGSEEEEEEDQGPSSHELKQDRLNRKIEEIEEEALEEKSWQLKGEISATNRPQNSLLQEVVEFDLTTRPAPVMTEQTSMQLEDIIKQRIKDRVFDSVERKIKPVETPLEYKKKLVLDQEKSKESLAQIYEKEYLEQTSTKDEETEKKEPELHLEINKLMTSLFSKLDALSNFHFTPKPAIPELKIVSNLPAINMEEVAPVASSDANLLAPQEVKKATKGDTMGKAERTSTDKKRERRKKKLKQKIHAKEKQLQTTVPNKKYSKEKAKKMVEKITKENNVNKMVTNDAKAVKSSKAFFTQLEEQVKSQIKRKTDGKTKKSGNTPSAKKLKL